MGNPSLLERLLKFLDENDTATAKLIQRMDDHQRGFESPRRFGSVSPTRMASPNRLPAFSNKLSQYTDFIDYDVMDEVPEKDWRLLATLARKRDQEIEREKLAVEFRRIWEQEKKERDVVTAETMNQYKKYLDRKREQEKLLQDFRAIQRETEEKVKQHLLEDTIRHKEKRSAKQLNIAQDIKVCFFSWKMMVEEWKRRTEMEDCLRRLEDAQKKREAKIRDTSKRVAINNALSSWEAAMLKQEAAAFEEYKRAQHAAHAQLVNLRSARLARSKALREKRARRVAEFTQKMRDAVRMTPS
ncbi:hypothetical protein NE865_05374 [Phthorimaea operculella]|nr:hypothetical protein NE865_05374 [Phthorimaea operculella]